MKKAFLILGACALLAFATPAAANGDVDFYSIKVSDLTEGLPVVTVGGYFTNVNITLGKESAIITGTAKNIIATVNLETLMLSTKEPAPFISRDGFAVSDIMLFQHTGDNFTLTFKSDGASGFDTAYYTGIDETTGQVKPGWLLGGVVEDGTMQWLGSIGIDAPVWIQLYGQSDVAPLPSTLLLLGTGLALLPAYAWRNRRV